MYASMAVDVAGAQLQMRHLHPAVNAANHQALLAPVKLERFAQRKSQWHEIRVQTGTTR